MVQMHRGRIEQPACSRPAVVARRRAFTGSQRLSLDDLGAHPLALRRICPPAYGEAARPQRGDFLMSDSSTDAPLAPPRLVALGLTSRQAKAARADATRCVGRVAEDRRIHFLLYTEEGQKVGACMPELLRDARKGTALRPVVGDFVVFDPALNEGLVTIIDVLPRESAFIRNARGMRSRVRSSPPISTRSSS